MLKLLFKSFIILILLISGITKMINPHPLIEVLETLPFVLNIFIPSIVTLFPILEIILAIGLIWNIKIDFTFLTCNLLFFFFFIFAIYGMLVGLNTDCGCFGGFFKSYFDWKMIFRNFIFLLISSYLTISNNTFQKLKLSFEK